ncbi:Ig-like domain-containing alpha-2-macroglobulin family protein [Candidatus Oscillochloris fontis]|uniref:Ig-like domain-containing alpha-2-macroglobulin family protein n=1 Tax=Candidatus Oscillochloris fontis TaxID=2496868 RepID=UPI00101DA535|nr:Ig-like domain-containing protein [Candidatus Oscillochloris fontis]
MQVLRRLARIWTVLLAVVLLTLGVGLLLRWLAPRALGVPAPALLQSTPADGAVGVLPRHELVLRFHGPMNRATTEAALRLDPPTPGHLHWSDDAQTLRFVPTTALLPATDYTLLVSAEAQGRWWQPLAEPLRINFRTAALPAVVTALPQGLAVPLDSAMAVIFSQPMVAAAQLEQPFDLHYLQIEPPLDVAARWVDPSTLVIEPQTPLHAATHYTATISADLADLRGVDLGQPFMWRWSTAWPEILDLSPAEAERWVGPHQPWLLSLSAPLDLDCLRAALRLDPPTEYTLSSTQIAATQVVTITPTLHWAYGQDYQVALQPSDPALADPPPLSWRLRVAPEPGLIAFFPGQGQALAQGQEVRLIFRTPMEAAGVQAGLRLDPPVDDLRVQVRETEVRLQASLLPSTAYTLTLTPDLRDRLGESLGITRTVQLHTAPAEPLLRIPAAQGHLLVLPLGEQVQLEVEHINLAQLDLSLYPLDLPTLVRAINLEPDQWRDFAPERYGQTLLRRWQVALRDSPDQLVPSQVRLELADTSALPQGIYYLRVRSPAGPQLDLLVQVSNLSLSMREHGAQMLVWATQRTAGEPVADLPLLLYADDALLARGQTDADGVWRVPVVRDADLATSYLVLADGDQPALVQREVVPPDLPPRLLLFLDQPSYQPGDSLEVDGFVRVPRADGAFSLPTQDLECHMQLEQPADQPLVQAACRVEQGIVRGTLAIPPAQEPGRMQLRVTLGEVVAHVPFDLLAPTEALDLHLDAALPPAPPQVRLNLRSRVLAVHERPQLELFSLDGAGRPLPDQPLKVAVYRTTSNNPAPLLVRSLRTDAQGRADLQLVQLQAGHYRVVASLGEVQATAPLWVTRDGYSGWENPPAQVALVTDRDHYQPGDVARILITAPVRSGFLLLTSANGSLGDHQVRELRAGQILDLEITPQMAPMLNLAALLAVGETRLAGASTIWVDAVQDVPDLGLSAASDPYAPGATATLTMTNPLVSEVLVTLSPADTPDLVTQFAAWHAATPADGVLVGGMGYLVPLSAGGAGDAERQLRIPLPNQRGEWRVRLYAALPNGQIVTDAITVTTQQPLDLVLHAPPALRLGDQAEVTLWLHNTSPISQQVDVRLLVLGGELEGDTPALHTITLEPSTRQVLVWRVAPRQAAQVLNLRYSLRGPQIREQISQEIAILPDLPALAADNAGLRLYPVWKDLTTGQPISLDTLPTGQVVALDLTLIALQPLPAGHLAVELPAALRVEAQHLPTGWASGDLNRLSLPLTYPDLAPGVYRVRLVLRVAYAGRFMRTPTGSPMIVSEP